MANQQATGAAAAPNTKAANPEVDEPKSTGEPIESIAVRDFYDDGMRYIQEGQTYVYQPAEDQPYPYANIHPIDKALDKRLKKEFDEFKQKKQDEIKAKSSLRSALRTLSESSED